MVEPARKQQKINSDDSLLPPSIPDNAPFYVKTKLLKEKEKTVKNFIEEMINVEDTDSIQTIFEQNINHRQILLDKMKKTTETKKDIRQEKRVNKRKLKCISRRNIKQIELLKKQERKKKEFNDFIKLNKLWNEYIIKYLGTNKAVQNAYSKLVKADFHGAMITVIESSCPSLIGLSGIIIQETMNTFRIITKEDKEKVIPKKRNNISVQIGEDIYTIYGEHFQFRSAERSVRKYKYKPFVTL